jgi:hypothetical protein
MILGYWELKYLDKLMADHDLLKIYYYLCAKQDMKTGYVEITLREAELGTGINKNKIKRKIEQLVMLDLVALISADRSGTKLIIKEPFGVWDEEKAAIYEKYGEQMKVNDSEIWRRLYPEKAKALDIYLETCNW